MGHIEKRDRPLLTTVSFTHGWPLARGSDHAADPGTGGTLISDICLLVRITHAPAMPSAARPITRQTTPATIRPIFSEDELVDADGGGEGDDEGGSGEGGDGGGEGSGEGVGGEGGGGGGAGGDFGAGGADGDEAVTAQVEAVVMVGAATVAPR